MSKIPPSARLREIAAFLGQAEGSESGAQALSRFVQLATAGWQEALEQEQTDFIGRAVRPSGHPREAQRVCARPP